MKKVIDNVKLMVLSKPEVYSGELTGKTVFHCAQIAYDAAGLGAVLGRGYSADEALADFVRRAELDGYTFKNAPTIEA